MRHTFTTRQILNVLTGVLHTNVDDIYNFFNKVIGDGIMTHMLPRAFRAIKPILENKFPALPHEGWHPDLANDQISFEFTEEDKKLFWERYGAQPNPLEGKEITIVTI